MRKGEQMKKIVDMDKWLRYYKEVMQFYDAQHKYDNGYINATDNIDAWLESQPDAEEEKHGKWVSKDYTHSVYANCTNCDEEFLCEGEWSFESWSKYMHFCPNCGAKMDLGEEED